MKIIKYENCSITDCFWQIPGEERRFYIFDENGVLIGQESTLEKAKIWVELDKEGKA